jgi:lipopolysaccharide exporter
VPTAPRWGRFAILWLCLMMSAVTGALCVVGSAVYWLLFEKQFNPALPLLFGLTVFLTGVTLCATLYLMRHDQYRATSVSAVARTGATVVTQLGLGAISASSASLIIGSVLGLAVQTVILAWSMWAHARPAAPRRSHIIAMFRRYRRQVTIDMPSTLLAIGSMNAPTFLIAALYGQRIVGYYGFAQRIAILPLQLFNDSLSQIFFQKAARAQEDSGNFWPELRFNLISAGAVSLATVIGIWLFAAPVVHLYLGAKWAPVATMLIVLAPMLGFRSLAYSVTPTIFILRRVHWRFIHFVIEGVLHLTCYAAALALGLGAIQYLVLVSALFSVEWVRFLIQMIIGARKSTRLAAAPAAP